MWLFKAIGMALIFSAFSLWGFLKSVGLKKRSEKLLKTYKGINILKEKIRLSSGDIESFLSESFDMEILINPTALELNTQYLLKEDTDILTEFLENIGMGDREAECERAELYMGLIKNRCEKAEQSYNELSKLYNTLGVLTGIFICIFLF